MVVYLVNNSKRTIYVARRLDGPFNGYEKWHGGIKKYDTERPGETDHWTDNERLVFSFGEITDYDASPTFFTDIKCDRCDGWNKCDRCNGPWRDRESGTWTYTFSASGWSYHEGMTPITT